MLVGERAGEHLAETDPRATHGVCRDCYKRAAQRAHTLHGEDIDIPPYSPSNRRVRPVVAVPLALLEQRKCAIPPSALRLYAELYQRGADRAWVAVSVAELAEILGYSAYMMRQAMVLLQRLGVGVRRAESRQSIPAFRIYGMALAGAA